MEDALAERIVGSVIPLSEKLSQTPTENAIER